MDQLSGKRGEGGIGTSREGYSSLKDAVSKENKSGQFCNRIGCNGRIKYSLNTKVGSSDKVKFAKQSVRLSNGKEMTGKCPGSSSSVSSRSKNSNHDSNAKFASKLKCDSSESIQSNSSESPEIAYSPPSIARCHSGSLKSGEVRVRETGSFSGISTNERPRRILHHSLQNRIIQPVSSVPSAFDSSFPGQSNGNSYSLRNLKHGTFSSAAPSCSSLKLEPVMVNAAKKRSLFGESSSAHRGNKTNGAPHFSPSTSGLSISDSKQSSSFEEGSSSVGSVSTQRSMNETTSTRVSSQQNGRKCPSVRQPRASDKEIPANGGGFSTSRQNSSSVEDSIGAAPLWTRRSMNESTRVRLSIPHHRRSSLSVQQPAQVSDNELPFSFGGQTSGRQFPARSYGLSSGNYYVPSTTMPRDFLNRNRMDEIVEVLLALERIEQNEELSHEQILALETSLLLSNLNLYDQHRDMRLEIDNMSYEELLALEERMGTVSTALSEEALSHCLERSTYHPTTSNSHVAETGKNNGDNTKCSICQEEYVIADEVGKLVECQHFYHVTCINQWLRLKNWCPICKASAAPSHTS